jgi:hypothetical protein
MVSKVSSPVVFGVSTGIAKALHRCDAKPDNLDAGNARLRNHRKTELLINTWDSRTLWTDFGVRADIVVSLCCHTSSAF